MKAKKIILTGTHCSGKTTLLNKHRDMNIDGVVCYDEMIRHLSKIPHFRFTFDPSDSQSILQYAFSEKALTSFYKGCAEFGDIYPGVKLTIMDRCIVDPFYYTTYFNLKKTLLDGRTLRQSLVSDIDYLISAGFFDNATLLLMKPLPLDVKDEFRLKGEEVQMGVYEEAKRILRFFDLDYLEVNTLQADQIIKKETEKLTTARGEIIWEEEK